MLAKCYFLRWTHAVRYWLQRRHTTKPSVRIVRSQSNPLLSTDANPELGDNINGPSVIFVPEWLPNPLGRYYLYFAHHKGKYIRLAYADSLDGPWQVYAPGVLHIDQSDVFHDHIASPDVHVDAERREIRMYFHGRVQNRSGQWSGCATSVDGLNFVSREEVLGQFYFRVWRYGGYWYALAKLANTGWQQVYRSQDGFTGFEAGGTTLPCARHTAVVRRDDQLLVFYSRVGDAPERILLSTIDLTQDWRGWLSSRPIEVLRPGVEYEGIGYPLRPSNFGAATRVRQLRDPFVLQLEDQTAYLFYTISGEMGLALAELKIDADS